MKVINPFERFKDKEFKPRSLFPASKMTRTSMPIGRLVPLYTCEMMSGDKIKLQMSQLTRFLPMVRPVMQNYEFAVGAFFVPYRSLDRFTDFNSKYDFNVLGVDALSANDYRKYALNARNFFNPETSAEDRVHPVKFSAERMRFGSQKWTSSLFDHLGYFAPIIDSLHLSMSFKATYNASDLERNNISVDTLVNDAMINGSMTWPALLWWEKQDLPIYNYRPYWDTDKPISLFNNDTSVQDSIQVLPFIPWLIYNLDYCLENGVNDPHEFLKEFRTPRELYDSYNPDNWDRILSNDDFTAMVINAEQILYGTPYDKVVTSDFLDIVRLDALIDLYKAQIQYDYLNLCSANYAVTRFLAYHSVYSDWFLPEHFIDCDDYRYLIGNGYINYCYMMEHGVTDPNFELNYENLADLSSVDVDDPCFNFYIEQLKSGECMPILLNKDRLVGALPNEQFGDKTAMADTIEDNMYNRALAKFKQLINRIGKDYRDVHESIYGHRPDDKTLHRSQVIGFRSFDVQIGDVAQTTPTGQDSILGQFGGYAVSRDSMKPFEWTADEEGMIMVMGFIRPKYVCFSGKVGRDLLKENIFDYLLPQFGGVGYQQISGAEANPHMMTPESVFGYEERYSEYMSVDNEVSGYMRTTYRDWNSDLLKVDSMNSLLDNNVAPLYVISYDPHRVFVNKATDPVIVSCYFDGTVTRALPSNIRLDY